jgi:Alkylmercury lyase
MTAEHADGAGRALAAARIPATKLGRARGSRVDGAERELYFWILRSFAATGRPSGAETRTEAARLGLDPARALRSLAEEDLVHVGTDGEITVAYPFSGRPTAHRVRFSSGNEVFSMCGIDALGTAPMFGQEIEVRSRDPLNGEEVRVRLAPDGSGEWPQAAVVVAGADSTEGGAFCWCCPVVNFFASESTASRWLDLHPQVRGEVVTMRDAIGAGRAAFGDVFSQS